MSRELRPLVDGGLYHVFCRCARQGGVFADPAEARIFIDLLRELKHRDGWTVVAWSVMPEHYHIALRTSSIRLSRTMHALQGRFAQGYNRRHGTVGSLWQGRFKTCLVNEQRHLDDLVVYVHLDPMRQEIAVAPEDYPFCGHRELIGEEEDPIIDVGSALQSFESTREEARRAYVEQIRACRHEAWYLGGPTRTPWWRTSRNFDHQHAGDELDPHHRIGLSAERFLELACRALGTELQTLASRFRAPEIVHHRELVATLGLERFDIRAKAIARLLSKHPDWISHLASQGARRRLQDETYRLEYERVEAAIVFAVTGGRAKASSSKDESDWAVW